MQFSISIPKKSSSKFSRYTVRLGYVIVLIFTLAVLQDFIFSKVKGTGFYLSESVLYNTVWLFLFPFSGLAIELFQKIPFQAKPVKFSVHFLLSLLVSSLHLIVFALFFTLISEMLFTPPHRFTVLLGTAFSNQFYIIVFWYTLVPLYFVSDLKKIKGKRNFAQSLSIYTGATIEKVEVSIIERIISDKPYCAVITVNKKILSTKSLHYFETQLNPNFFSRVHRSTILNIEFVVSMESRKNGDYDATLKSGATIRLSRHYRSNWERLLH